MHSVSVDENILAGSPEDTLVGTLFADHYEIISVLGKGGMSVVYKARYTPLDQLVAVKIMQTHMTANPATYQRLAQEAKLSSSLNHPNIVRILRMHISDDGFPFLVAELLSGRTISSVIREDGAFDEKRFERVFMQVLDALEHAHSRGVIHRDIKPSNIMLVDEDGQSDVVKIVDFGISKMLTDSAAVTQGVTQTPSGNIFGSPPYMSPEQCTGGRTDARTDIYALACVMYEALTGEPAFSGDTALDTMYHQVHDMPRTFTEVAPERTISPHLEAAIFAALRKDKADRPQKVQELRAIITGKATPRRTSQMSRARRLARRAMVPVFALALGAVFVIGSDILNQSTTSGDPQAAPPAAEANISYPTQAASCLHEGISMADSRIESNNTRLEKALRYFRRADELLKAQKDTPDAVAFEIKYRMGLTLNSLGKNDEAVKYLKEAMQLAEAVPLRSRVWVLSQLSSAAAAGNDNESALKFALQAARNSERAILQAKVAPEFRTAERREAADSWVAVAGTYDQLGKYKEEEEAWRKALNLAREQDDAQTKLTVLNGYALFLYRREGRGREAERLMREFLAIETTLPDSAADYHARRALGHEAFAFVLTQMGNPAGAQAEHARAVELAQRVAPHDKADMQRFLGGRLANQALNFYDLNQIDKGDQTLARALQLLQQSGDQTDAAFFATQTEKARSRALLRLQKTNSGPGNRTGERHD